MLSVCGFCGQRYDPEGSLGLWRCGQHAADPEGGAYPCCGAPCVSVPRIGNLDGACVPADHRETGSLRYTVHHDVEVGFSRAKAIHERNPRAVAPKRNAMIAAYVVHRYDHGAWTRNKKSLY